MTISINVAEAEAEREFSVGVYIDGKLVESDDNPNSHINQLISHALMLVS